MFERELTTADYVAMFRRRWLLILALAVVGTSLAYGISKFLPNLYQSEAQILIEKPTVSTDVVKPVVNTDNNERIITMEQQILSPPRLEPLIHHFALYSKELDSGMPAAKVVALFRSAIEVIPIRPGDDSGVISSFYIRVTLDNPQATQEVCTSIASMFVEESARRRQEQSEETTQFLGQQIADAKVKLDEQDARLAAFQSKHLGSLPDDAQTNMNLLGGLTAELDAATQAITHAQQDKNLAESMLAQQIAARQASRTGQNPDTLGDQLAAAQTRLAELQARYTDDYPDVVKTKIEIEAMKNKIAESEKKGDAPNTSANPTLEPLQFTQLRAQIRVDDQTIAQKTKQQEQIQQQIRAYQERVQLIPVVGQEFKEITRDHQTALDFYNSLLAKRSESVMATNLEARQEGEQYHVLTPANLPDKPSVPNRQLIAVGGFGGGLAFGLGLAFLLEMRDTSLRTDRDVEILLQLPVLAVVPAIKSVSSSKAAQSVDQTRFISASGGA